MKTMIKVFIPFLLFLFTPIKAYSVTYTYGNIPVTAQLCTTLKNGFGVESSLSFNAGLSGELGGGWEKALHIAGKIPVEISVAAGADINAGASIYTENCLEVINTLDPVDTSNLTAQEIFLLDAILLSATGERIDESELALNIIKHGISNNVALPQTRGVVAVYGKTINDVVDFIVKPKLMSVEEVMLNIVHTVDNLSDVLPAHLKQSFLHPDQVFSRHLANIDIIGKSCADLENGRITHFPAELKYQIQLFCDNLSFIKTEGLAFLNTIPDSVKAIQTVAISISDLSKSVDTVGFITGQVNKSVDKVRNGADKVISDIKIVANSMKRIGKQVETTMNEAKATIDQGISEVSVVTTEVKSIGNEIKGIADESKDFLVNDIQGNVNQIFTASTNLVNRSISAVMSPVCALGITVLTVSVNVSDILSAINGSLNDALCG